MFTFKAMLLLAQRIIQVSGNSFSCNLEQDDED
jgi:hypothetical protein